MPLLRRKRTRASANAAGPLAATSTDDDKHPEDGHDPQPTASPPLKRLRTKRSTIPSADPPTGAPDSAPSERSTPKQRPPNDHHVPEEIHEADARARHEHGAEKEPAERGLEEEHECQIPVCAEPYQRPHGPVRLDALAKLLPDQLDAPGRDVEKALWALVDHLSPGWRKKQEASTLPPSGVRPAQPPDLRQQEPPEGVTQAEPPTGMQGQVAPPQEGADNHRLDGPLLVSDAKALQIILQALQRRFPPPHPIVFEEPPAPQVDTKKQQNHKPKVSKSKTKRTPHGRARAAEAPEDPQVDTQFSPPDPRRVAFLLSQGVQGQRPAISSIRRAVRDVAEEQGQEGNHVLHILDDLLDSLPPSPSAAAPIQSSTVNGDRVAQEREQLHPKQRDGHPLEQKDEIDRDPHVGGEAPVPLLLALAAGDAMRRESSPGEAEGTFALHMALPGREGATKDHARDLQDAFSTQTRATAHTVHRLDPGPAGVVMVHQLGRPSASTSPERHSALSGVEAPFLPGGQIDSATVPNTTLGERLSAIMEILHAPETNAAMNADRPVYPAGHDHRGRTSHFPLSRQIFRPALFLLLFFPPCCLSPCNILHHIFFVR